VKCLKPTSKDSKKITKSENECEKETLSEEKKKQKQKKLNNYFEKATKKQNQQQKKATWIYIYMRLFFF
jgi:hypothetical protein